MRSSLLVPFVVVFALAAPEGQSAATPLSPAQLVPLVAKAADYDRRFASKAPDHVRIDVVYNSGEPSSEANARAIALGLAGVGKIAGMVHEERAVAYSGADALAADVRAQQIAIVVVSTGMSHEIRSIAHELDGINVLSVAVDPDDVARGVVLGVDTRNGKPKLVVRLAQARRQNVLFEASLLSLARIE